MKMNDINPVRLPEVWSGWRITSLLGKGSYASVYRAEDAAGNVCAIKIMRMKDFAGHDHWQRAVWEPEFYEQLYDSPGVVRVEDYLVEGGDGEGQSGILYLRMECLTDLNKWRQARQTTEETALQMMLDLCDALECCEKTGILHRDIKPGNILITGDGHAKLCDFGTARLLEGTNSSLTVQGTFAYMAPEVYHGQKYGHGADLYSLGLVFYQWMNGGSLPFEDQVGEEEALKKRMKGRKLPCPTECSREFADILLKLCSYQPKDRYRSAAKLKEDLKELQAGTYRIERSPAALWRRAERPARLTLVFLFLLLAAGASWAGWYYYPLVWREDCGTETVWTLHRNGTLVVSGEGMMDGLLQESRVFPYSYMIRKIVVKKEVKYVDFRMTDFPNLEEVVLSDGVEEMHANSFSLKSKLKRVRLSNSLTSIPDEAFSLCGSLQDIQIPGSVTEIGSSAFLGTPWLERLKEESTTGFVMVNDILIAYVGQEREISITQDMGIHSIASDAFEDSNIRSITMDESVEYIGAQAFNRSSLETAVLPDDLDQIPVYLFGSCENLKKVTLPKKLKEIQQNAFLGCLSLKELDIPESVECIGWHAFEETPFQEKYVRKDGYTVINGYLISYEGVEENLVIPEELGIRRICDSAFEQQMSLKSVVLPEGITGIGEKAFFMCQNLEDITFPESLEDIGRSALDGTEWLNMQAKKEYIIVNDMLLKYYGGKETVTIPENPGFTKIMGVSFTDRDLEEITIPEGITFISEYAFDGCINLKKIHLPEGFPEEEIERCFKETPWYYLRN